MPQKQLKYDPAFTPVEYEAGFTPLAIPPAKSQPARQWKGTALPLPRQETITGLLPLIGGTVGALGGAGLASIPGAFLGAEAGEAARQLINRALGLAAPSTSTEAAEAIEKQGILQAIGQTFGLGVGGVMSKILAPFSRHAISPVVKEAADIGVRVSPAEAIPTSGFVRGLQARAEQTAAGRPVMVEFYKKEAEKFARAIEAGGERIGPKKGLMRVGSYLSRGFEKAKESFHNWSTATYSPIFKQADASPGGWVGTTELKAWANQFRQEYAPVLEHLRAADSKLPAIIENVESLPQILKPSLAQAYRSSLLSEIRKAGLITGRLQGVEKTVSGFIDKEIEDSLVRTGGKSLADKWRKANVVFAKHQKILEESDVAHQAIAHPEKLADMIWSASQTSNALALGRTLTGKFSDFTTRRAWDIIRRRGFENLLSKASVGEAEGIAKGVVQGRKLSQLWEDLGPDLRKAMAGDQLENVQRFVRIARETNLDKAVTLTRGMLGFYETGIVTGAGLAGAGTLIGAVAPSSAARIMTTALIVVATPKYAAQMLTSDTGIRYLIQGLKVPVMGKEGIRLIGRIAASEAGSKKTLRREED